MKKLIRIFLILSAVAAMSVVLTACGKTVLKSPEVIGIDENNKLTWSTVENARTYTIEIYFAETGEEAKEPTTSRKTYYDLSVLEEGDYNIRLRANGDKDSVDSSEWNEFTFRKDYETGCVYRSIDNGTAYSVSKVGSATGNVVLEDVYRNKPVVKIADEAFKGSGRIESVVIGKYVTEIGEKAFYNCPKLTSVTLPDSLTAIGKTAFQSCRSLAEITIPSKVDTIEENTFAYCSALKKVVFSEGVIKLKDYAFWHCTSLEEVVFPDSLSVIGENVFAEDTAVKSVKFGSGITDIGNYSFFRCTALNSVGFEQTTGQLTIGEYAFSECALLEEVELPEGLTSIGYAAFYKAEKLSLVTVPESLEEIGVGAFNYTAVYPSEFDDESPDLYYVGDWIVGISPLLKIAAYKFEGYNIKLSVDDGKTVLKEVAVKEDVKGIGNGVFQNCENLYEIVFPSSLKYVGMYAFKQCKNVWRATVPEDSVEVIGDRAFEGCTALSRVSLGNGLKVIGYYAFYNCTVLTNTVNNQERMIPASVTSIGYNAFKNTLLWNDTAFAENGVVYAGTWAVGFKFSSVNVTLRANTTGIADYAFYDEPYVRTIQGLNRVKIIGEGAFYNNADLTFASLNDDLTEIKDYTFYGCNSLISVGDLPYGLNSVGRSAFYNCTTLREIDLSACNVKTIGDYAFYNCSNLRQITFPDKLEDIGTYSFYKCSALREIRLPASLKTVSARAFGRNTALENVDLGNVEALDDYAFTNCTSLKSVTVPDTVVSIGKSAFYNCVGLEALKFGAGLKTISDYAFYGAESLKALVIPENVTYVGKLAFKGAKSLSSVVLTDIKVVASHAFYGCSSATFYYTANKISNEWNARWNSSLRPVVFNAKLSDTGDYVDSVKVSDVLNGQRGGSLTGIAAPYREGHVFVGWAKSEGGEPVYSAEEIAFAKPDEVIYSVWEVAPAAAQPPADET